MKQGKRALVLFSMMNCVVWGSLISEVAYSQGYDNATVLKVQEELQARGYNPGPLDGIWGSKTKRALRKFQYGNGLPLTGKIDLPTKEKLGLIKPNKDVTEQSIAKEETKPSAPEDAAEPAVTEGATEPIVTEDTAEPPVTEGAVEPPVTEGAVEPIVSFAAVQDGMQGALQSNWNIKTVQIKNGVLTVVPVSDAVTKDEYVAMIPQICEEISKYPHTFDRLKEIRVLNTSENQGWALLAPKQCDRITKAPSTQLEKVIFRQSADILIFTSGQR